MLPRMERMDGTHRAVLHPCRGCDVRGLKGVHRVRNELVSKSLEVVMAQKVLVPEFRDVFAAEAEPCAGREAAKVPDNGRRSQPLDKQIVGPFGSTKLNRPIAQGSGGSQVEQDSIKIREQLRLGKLNFDSADLSVHSGSVAF